MLGSITPLGERARNSRWAVPASFYAAGSLVAGALLGLGAGALGEAGRRALHVPPAGAMLLLAAAIAAGILLDVGLGGTRLPSIHRQVDEDWLHRYRPWVYGLAFGFQLGLGVVTIVAISATYVLFLAAFLTASPAQGAIIGGAFGMIRALPLLAVFNVRGPSQLGRVDAALRHWDRPARSAALWLQGAVGVAAVTGALVR
jgi:hypothetical protein